MDRRQTDPHLKALREHVEGIDARLTKHLVDEEASKTEFVAELAKNTELTKRVEENTAEIVRAWQSLEGGLRVLKVAGTIAKYVFYILTAFSAGWAIAKGFFIGVPPGGSP